MQRLSASGAAKLRALSGDKVTMPKYKQQRIKGAHADLGIDLNDADAAI